MNTDRMSEIFSVSLLLLSGICLDIHAHDLSNYWDSSTVRCFPDVEFHFKNAAQSFCLNNFIPQGDSCANLEIFFKSIGIKVNFQYDKKNNWNYTGMGYANLLSQRIPVNVSLTTDETDKLAQAVVLFGKYSDTSNFWIDRSRNWDIPVIPDSTKLLDYDLNLSRFICIEQPAAVIIANREFSYPAGFRRKEPDLNYPELSAFHWGKSVRMPNAGVLQKNASMMNYWHMQKLPLLTYDDPELIRRRELYNAKWEKRHPPKKKKIRTRPPLLRFKAL